MRLCKIVILMAALLTGSAAVASGTAPAEQPPADFTARQYIDSKGCVFLRQDGQDWQARQGRDGTALCGYPPTFSARRVSPDGMAGLSTPARPAISRAEHLEQALNDIVITNLRPGELASDPRPLARLPDLGPEPASQDPTLQIQAEMAALPGIQARLGHGLRPNQELCHLLGYNGAPSSKPAGLGQDPTQGFCESLPRNDLARLAFSRPVPLAQPASEAIALSAQAATMTALTVVRPAQKPAAGGGKPAPKTPVTAQVKPSPAKSGGKGGNKAGAPKPSPNDVVPPGARYVQVGAFANAGNADRAVRKLSDAGLPILRSRGADSGLHLIVAGPFSNRQAVVIALDKIRRAGFRDSYPR